MQFTTASIQCFHCQSLTVTTQTRRELLSRRNLCHAKCLEQLSNTSRWKTQKLKATFYKLTRHAGHEPLAAWMLQVQLELQSSAAPGSWHPCLIPLDALGRLHSFPMARVPSLQGKPYCCVSDPPTCACCLRRGCMSKVTGKANIMFIWRFLQ